MTTRSPLAPDKFPDLPAIDGLGLAVAASGLKYKNRDDLLLMTLSSRAKHWSGHTDNVPIAFSRRFQSNWDLSAARSSSVADYLLENGYTDAGRVTVTGFADTIPVASNDTSEGRSKNRRIEIMIDSSGEG